MASDDALERLLSSSAGMVIEADPLQDIATGVDLTDWELLNCGPIPDVSTGQYPHLDDINSDAFNFNSMAPEVVHEPRLLPPGYNSLVQPQPLNTAAVGFMNSGGISERATPLACATDEDELAPSGGDVVPFNRADQYIRVQKPNSHATRRQQYDHHQSDPNPMFVPHHEGVRRDEDEHGGQDHHGYRSHSEHPHRRPSDGSPRHPYRHSRLVRTNASQNEAAQRNGHDRRRSSAGIRKRSLRHTRQARTTAPASSSQLQRLPQQLYRPAFLPPKGNSNIKYDSPPFDPVDQVDPYPNGTKTPPRTNPLDDPINLFILQARRDKVRSWTEIAGELNARKNSLGLALKDFTEAAVYGRFTRNGSRIAQRLGQPAFDPRDFMHIKEGGGLRSGRSGSHAVASGLRGLVAAEPSMSISMVQYRNNGDGVGNHDDDGDTVAYTETSGDISVDDMMLYQAFDRISSSEDFWKAVANEYAVLDEAGRVHDAASLRDRHRRMNGMDMVQEGVQGMA